MSRPGRRLAIAVAIQFVILLGLLAFKQYTLLTGETVVLRVHPIDPRDLFRGDYVTLSLDVSNLDLSTLETDDYFGWDDTIYVELEEDGAYWRPVAAYSEHRQEHKPSVVIKGKVKGHSSPTASGLIAVEYGIEDVFIPEDTGRAIGEVAGSGDLGLEVRVDRWGNAIARRLLLNGELYRFQRR